MKKSVAILMFFLLFVNFTAQEKHQFSDEIENFKKLDSANAPQKKSILLLGSSSFTKWTDVSDYFPKKVIINRGFGGSNLLDLNYFADEILKPYSPKQIIIYCGENDFAMDENVSSEEVYKRFLSFYKKARQQFPNIEIDFVSIKNSPSRVQYWDKMLVTNSLIKAFLKKEKNADYIDITEAMLDSQGKIREELYLEDMLHMKAEGYKIWAKEMKPYMK